MGGANRSQNGQAAVAEPADGGQGGAAPSDMLQRLSRGEISVDDYLEWQVERSVDHVRQLIGPEQLEIVKQTLREQLATDPVLAEYVSKTTG
jgi:hypothetical protein